MPPFHWAIEFPEVFGRENGGFDGFVGNPPFAGKNTLTQSNRTGYLDWLNTMHIQSHGNAELVHHFFRRAFNLLNTHGSFGLIATNTVGQGDTRATGLRWICTNGGTVFAARRRVKWPGVAAVVISIVHVSRYSLDPPFSLDGRPSDSITAYLFHRGGHENPSRLVANDSKAFIGTYVLGLGFTFDGDGRNGEATPLSEMKRLVEDNPTNSQRIFPYIGGEEVNDNPTHSPRRYVINFGRMTEEQAREWPDLMDILERKVRAYRQTKASIVNPKRWWMFARPATELYEAIEGRSRVLVCPIISNKLKFAFLPPGTIVSHKIAAFAYDSFAAFAVLQCQVHVVWAWNRPADRPPRLDSHRRSTGRERHAVPCPAHAPAKTVSCCRGSPTMRRSNLLRRAAWAVSPQRGPVETAFRPEVRTSTTQRPSTGQASFSALVPSQRSRDSFGDSIVAGTEGDYPIWLYDFQMARVSIVEKTLPEGVFGESVSLRLDSATNFLNTKDCRDLTQEERPQSSNHRAIPIREDHTRCENPFASC